MRNEGKAGLKLGRCRKSSQPIKFKSASGAAFAAPSTSQEVVPLFKQSDDWVLQFNLNFDGQTKNKHRSNRRPDGLIFSDKLKKVVWIELTSPWEDNLTKSYTCKKAKYNKLEKLVKASGWTVVPLYVEFGSRGIINDTWGRMCKALCMKKVKKKCYANIAVG